MPRRSPGSSIPLVAVDQAPHEGEQAGRHQAQAGQVERAVGPVGLAQERGRKRDEDDADRDVDPEDELPAEALDDRAADERPERDSEAGDRAPAPSARPRHSLVRRRRIVRVRGVTIAAPKPWRARARTTAAVGASAANRTRREQAKPMVNIRSAPPVAEAGARQQEVGEVSV